MLLLWLSRVSPPPCNAIDGSPQAPLAGILQARILEWVAIAFSEDALQRRTEPWKPVPRRTIEMPLVRS